MTVSLRDVVLAVSYGDASLVGESAGYLILGAADSALHSCERACLDSISIDEEGSVRLKGPRADEDEAEQALRGLLTALLGKVRIPSNNLARVAARRDLRGLRGLVAELEAALVPVNRRAARRTLARLCREAHKSAARQHAFAEVEEVPIETSPEPEQEQLAPSPAPVFVQSRSQGARAEHVLTVPARRASQLATVPAQPHPALLQQFAGIYGAQTPVESSQPVVEHQASQAVDAVAVASPAELEVEIFEEEDELDEAETQLFAAVAPIAEPARPLQNSSPPGLTFPPRRRHTASARPQRTVSAEESLIVMSETAPRRIPSDITDLLDKMAVSPTSTEELYTGLKSLSRIELSPLAPQVTASSNDEDRR